MGAFAPPLRSPAPAARSTLELPPAKAAPRKTELFHALLLATTFVVFAWRITLGPGLVAGALGATLGTVIAARLVARRIRTWVLIAGSALVLLAGLFVADLFLAADGLAALLGPVSALQLGEALRFGAAGTGLALGLRSVALRWRAALAVEGSVVVLAVATTVAAHRDGMIARPLEISDWFWGQGIDPVIAFLAVGLMGAVLLAGVLAHGRSGARTTVQLLLVLLLGAFLAARIHAGPPEAKLKNAVGDALEKEQDDQRDGQGGGGAQKEQKEQGNAFRDDLPNSGEDGKNRPAAIVVFHRDVTPGNGIFYFRHAAFSQFNGMRLVEATLYGVDPDARSSFPTEPVAVPGPHHDDEERIEVATDVALLSDHPRLFALTDASELSPMPNPEPARFRRAYRVVSRVMSLPLPELLGHRPGDRRWSDAVWEHYTALPADERYHELANRLQANLRSEFASDPIAMAMTVKRYLEESSTYSFKRKYEGADDPTAAFLFSEEKLGYCVHLAHAQAYLLRALGVPARVSAGYAVPAENLAGGSALLLKAGDAHAWAEVYLEGVGWVPVEVTPEKTDVEPQAFQEKDLQQLLGEMARKEGRFERQGRSGPKLADLFRQALGYVPLILLSLLVAAYLVKLWRLVAPRFFPARAAPRLVYRAALDRLAAGGFARDRGEPRERFAQRVAEAAPSFAPLTAAHLGWALGDPARPLEARERLFSLSSRVAGEVRRAVPWYRYLLGLLNPISWFWSR